MIATIEEGLANIQDNTIFCIGVSRWEFLSLKACENLIFKKA